MFVAAKNKYLGIMTCFKQGYPPFHEQPFYRNLCQVGSKTGVNVFVFSPDHIDWQNMQVDGYRFSEQSRKWSKRRFPLPLLIYDRCFYCSSEQYLRYRPHIQKLRQVRRTRFLGYGLKGKWSVQRLLTADEEIASHLPDTEICGGPQTILRWLSRKREFCLKPQGGSQGKGVLRVARPMENRFEVHGRDGQNRMIDLSFTRCNSLLKWLKRFIGGRKYIIQTYLSLTTHQGHAFDLRSLMQKNGKGEWTLTGMGVRRGKPGSITSNLHGGGNAEAVRPFLEHEFDPASTARIQETILRLSYSIPAVLEAAHGRLLELGIDFGIDKQGKVWILEVNSKPGRSIFSQLNDAAAKKTSVMNPIDYARYLLDRQLGG